MPSKFAASASLTSTLSPDQAGAREWSLEQVRPGEGLAGISDW